MALHASEPSPIPRVSPLFPATAGRSLRRSSPGLGQYYPGAAWRGAVSATLHPAANYKHKAPMPPRSVCANLEAPYFGRIMIGDWRLVIVGGLMKARIKWVEDRTFIGESGSGHKIVLGTAFGPGTHSGTKSHGVGP